MRVLVTTHVRVELDKRIFVAPAFATTTIAGWHVDGETVFVPGLYDIEPYDDGQRLELRAAMRRWHRNRTEPRPIPIGLNVRDNVVSRGWRAVLLEDNQPPRVLATMGWL